MVNRKKYLYETHMHTSQVSACAKSTAQEQIRTYKSRGYTGVIITDHFINGNSTCPLYISWDEKMRHFASGFNAAKAAGEKAGIDVFFGWEFSINGSDFLTYGLDLDFLLAYHDLDKLPIENYSALVRESGGYIAQAHPYRTAWYIAHSSPVDSHLLDGIEVYNALDSFKSNEKALLYAERNDLPVQAGSDSHSTDHLLYSGVALDRKAESIYDIIHAIKNREVELI